MEYFNFLTKGDTIGIVAPSMGVSDPSRKMSCDNAIKNFNKKGINIKFSDNCFNNNYARSCSAETRASEFENFFLDNNLKGLISIAGGEFELEVLSHINFNKLKKAPNKFFQGMSDNTCLGFTLATICDKASIYSSNLLSFGMKKWHSTLTDNFNFLCGNVCTQISNKKMEVESKRREPGNELCGYNLTKKTHPKILMGDKEIKFSGRIIGGCLDILSHICGTKFDNVKNFVKKYKDDGIIWFFESCDLNVLEQSRCIWKLKNAGWFENAKAFLIGRPLNTESLFDCSYEDCNLENLKSFGVPVVIDLDIGHTAPTWYIVNGAIANFEMKNNVAKINFELK